VRAARRGTARSQRPQVIEQSLLVADVEHIEVVDDSVRFRTTARVLLDGDLDVGRAAVMEKEDALTDTPERRAAELISCCGALRNAIGEPGSHIVQGKVTERLEGDVGCGRANRGVSGGLIDHVTGLASDIGKDLLTARGRSGRTRGSGRSRGRR